MKTKTKNVPEWKIDLISNLMNCLDTLHDEIDNSENDKDYINKAIKEAAEEIKKEILECEAEPDIKELVNDNDFVSDFLHELPVKSYKGTDILSHLQLIEEVNGYYIIECPSLAEVMKFEAFKEELEANPYQLKLIA